MKRTNRDMYMKELIVIEQEMERSGVTTHTLKFRYTNHVEQFKKFNFPENVIKEVNEKGVSQHIGVDDYDAKVHYTIIKRFNEDM